MKPTRVLKTAALAVVGAVVMFAAVRVVLAATNLDFTLHNDTGKSIHELYVSGHDDDDWGDDVLGRDILTQGEAVEIKFSKGKQSAAYDLKVIFDDKTNSTWSNFDLTQITDITLYFKDGTPFAHSENK